MPSIHARRIAAARLHGQMLVGEPTLTNPADVVRALGAVQSQDYAGAKWAVGQRARGLTDRDLDDACDRGEILRTHVLRPTWHFVAPEDLRWMQRLTGPRVAKAMSSYNVKLGLDAAVFRKSRKVIEKALGAHGQLTRTQLKVEFDRAGIVTEGTQRLAHLMMQAEVDCLVCSGPSAGKQSTYALLDARASTSRELAGDEALHELTLRYFASRAPATVHDFSWWSGMTMGGCRRGIELAGPALAPVAIDGTTYWAPPGFTLPERVPTTTHLLPNYDEYFIGFRNRSAIGQRMKSAALVTGGNALIAHVVAVDGQVVGGWKRAEKSGTTVVHFNLPVSLTRAERGRVDACVARFERFIGGTVQTR